MCGICGVYNFNSLGVNSNDLKLLNNEMILNSYFSDRFGDSIIDSMFIWGDEIKPNTIFYINECGILNSVLLDLYI